MSDELLKQLETGHDKECAMSYGMHEHCCDCSYVVRQEAAVRIHELEADRDSWRDQADQRVKDWDDMRQRAERAEAERLSLINDWKNACELMNRAEAERDAVFALSGQENRHRDELLAENETLRRDAERYKWLKSNARRIDFAGLCWSQGCELDARIDAAIGKEKG